LKKSLSISLRLTFSFSTVFLCGFAIFGVVMWLDLAYSLSSGRDRTLTRRSQRCVDLLESLGHDSRERRAAMFDDFAEATPEGNLIQVYDSHGARLFPAAVEPPGFPWPQAQVDAQPRFNNVLFKGRRYRILMRPFNAGPETLCVLVAGQLEDNRQLLARFATGLITVIPALLALSALGGYFLSRRALQPVDQLTAAVRSISIGNLSRRLPISSTGDELQRMAETCNAMLARLEDAVTRITRFTADASHELRSPISFIRTVTEYALRNPRCDPASRETFGEILAESEEAALLLEDMLTLARADAGHADAVFEPLDLAEVLTETCEKIRPLANAKRQALDTAADPGASISGDRSSLRRLLWILLDNAVKYTPEGGRIGVALCAAGSEATVIVRDTGIGIPAAMQPRIFDRFYRADPSRSQVDGAGLGLSIAKWIAEVHRATISVQSKEGKGTTFQVAFPRNS
jgi:heavy metal sensor kinase